MSSGEVQGDLGRGLPEMPPSVGGISKSFSPARPESVVDENENVEGSHETVSSGGVQGGLGRGLPVMPPSVDGISISFSPARPESVVDENENVLMSYLH